jgi:hypothetical protein
MMDSPVREGYGEGVGGMDPFRLRPKLYLKLAKL